MRLVATSSSRNIALKTMWDVGNSVDNNQELADSGINRFRNWIRQSSELRIHCLEIFYLTPFFIESGVPVNSGINRFRNCS